MPEEVTIGDLQTGLKEVRDLFEKKAKALDSLDLAKIEKVNAALDAQEDANQKSILFQKTVENKLKEIEEKALETEKLLAKGTLATDTEKQLANAEMKAFNDYFRFGKAEQKAELKKVQEQKYMRTDSFSDGGALVPMTLVKTVIKDVTEISPMRALCRVVQMGPGRNEIPIRTSNVTVLRQGEKETAAETQSKYGRRVLVPGRYSAYVVSTIEELNDGFVDVVGEINSDLAEAYAQAEGYDFVKGNGINRPFGLITNSEVGQFVTGSAAAITMDSILQIPGQVKTSYKANSAYIMNRKTIATARTLKDSQGQYHWQIGSVAGGVPNTLNGFNYVEVPDMDDIAANAFPIAFGDFRRAYQIGDKLSMAMIRDEYTLAADAAVRFIFHRWVGGDVTQPEAYKLLKCST